MKLLKIGRKYLKPHFCPDCGKFSWLVRYPVQRRCSACHNRHRRQKQKEQPKDANRYDTKYRRRAKKIKALHHYCALCGSTKNLTCHHCVDVNTKEWKGKHLTVLCDSCHRLWEMKVNTIRDLCKKGEL